MTGKLHLHEAMSKFYKQSCKLTSSSNIQVIEYYFTFNFFHDYHLDEFKCSQLSKSKRVFTSH